MSFGGVLLLAIGSPISRDHKSCWKTGHLPLATCDFDAQKTQCDCDAKSTKWRGVSGKIFATFLDKKTQLTVLATFASNKLHFNKKHTKHFFLFKMPFLTKYFNYNIDPRKMDFQGKS
jgi:hypothetical protein